MCLSACRLQVWRPAEGFGIRLDGGNAYPGATISPHYDSMLTKVTASALTWQGAADKLTRALQETRIRGVKTNTPFILNVLRHPEFLSGAATTSFIADHPELFDFKFSKDRGQKLLNYLGDLVVNGLPSISATPQHASAHHGAISPQVISSSMGARWQARAAA